MCRTLQPHLGSHAAFNRRSPSILIPVILGAGVGSPSSAPSCRLSAAFRDMNGIVLFVCFNDVSNQDLGETEEGYHRSLEAVCDLGRGFFNVIQKCLYSYKATSANDRVTDDTSSQYGEHWSLVSRTVAITKCQVQMPAPFRHLRARIGSLRLYRPVRTRRMTLNDT
jgi:hypothetical protein